MQDLVRPHLNPTSAGEAEEVHEFLRDAQGVPWKCYSSDGKLRDENGSYYILPLVDRVMSYGDSMRGNIEEELINSASTRASSEISDEVKPEYLKAFIEGACYDSGGNMLLDNDGKVIPAFPGD